MFPYVLFDPETTATGVGVVEEAMTGAGVTSALTTVMEVLGECVTFIGGNPVLMVIFTGSLVGMGFKLFKKAKRSVK